MDWLFEKEYCVVSELMEKPEHPCVFVLGGSKISDAFMMMGTVLSSGAADTVLTGGLVGEILLASQGKEIGSGTLGFILKSGYGDFIEKAKGIYEKYADRIILPEDLAQVKDGARDEALAGDVTAAHREGCRFLDRMYLKRIPARADIVIVSQGGAPKDLNLYQTQKALDNAKHAVKPGGAIILIGSCREGLGSRVFEEWLLNAPSAHSMIERIGREFQLGGHKAAAIAMVLENAEIYLVSDMPDEFVQRIFLKPAHSAQEALDAAFARLGPGATVLAMPYGGSTLPRAEG